MRQAAAIVPASGLRFSKMHGAGNDFVVLDLRDNRPLVLRLWFDKLTMSGGIANLCRALADRRTGVGCDQILTIEPPRAAGSVASYRIWNADGSPSQQCGNGARCVAAWLVRDGAVSGHAFDLDSPAGTHGVEALGADRYQIGMGVPQFLPQAIPLLDFDAEQNLYQLDLDGQRIRFGAVSMGNPHAVIEVADVLVAPVATLAPALQQHPAFPESANIGFAEVLARDRIRLRVYERGVGETLACGSGACAAVAVLTRQGRIGSDHGVTVMLPGGDLHIVWPEATAQVRMTGPAAFVYEGDWIS